MKLRLGSSGSNKEGFLIYDTDTLSIKKDTLFVRFLHNFLQIGDRGGIIKFKDGLITYNELNFWRDGKYYQYRSENGIVYDVLGAVVGHSSQYSRLLYTSNMGVVITGVDGLEQITQLVGVECTYEDYLARSAFHDNDRYIGLCASLDSYLYYDIDSCSLLETSDYRYYTHYDMFSIREKLILSDGTVILWEGNLHLYRYGKMYCIQKKGFLIDCNGVSLDPLCKDSWCSYMYHSFVFADDKIYLLENSLHEWYSLSELDKYGVSCTKSEFRRKCLMDGII